MIDTHQLAKAAVLQWLQTRGDAQRELFRQARAVRSDHGGDEVLLRGVIEISNHCEKCCSYCAMRCPNKALHRYRMAPEEILGVATQMRSRGISTAFLQAGQDRTSDEILEKIIPKIRFGLGMDVLLCVGERPREVYRRYAELGAGAYILKYETSHPDFYRATAQASLADRLECLAAIREVGMKLGTGNMVGLPHQTLESIADDFLFAVAIQPDYVSTAPFIPNEGTPFEPFAHGDPDLTLNLMTLWRIALKTCLMPAVSALEKIRSNGQLMGLQAGANVMTVNFTPEEYRSKYAIYSEQRFIVSLKHADEVIRRTGLRTGSETSGLCAG